MRNTIEVFLCVVTDVFESYTCSVLRRVAEVLLLEHPAGRDISHLPTMAWTRRRNACRSGASTPTQEGTLNPKKRTVWVGILAPQARAWAWKAAQPLHGGGPHTSAQQLREAATPKTLNPEVRAKVPWPRPAPKGAAGPCQARHGACQCIDITLNPGTDDVIFLQCARRPRRPRGGPFAEAQGALRQGPWPVAAVIFKMSGFTPY